MPVASAVPATSSFDPLLFQKHRRIHVVGGSFFGQNDEMLMIVHPGDLKQENLMNTRRMLASVMTHREPQWFSVAGRVNLVASLAELFPLSRDAEGVKLAEAIKDYVHNVARSPESHTQELAQKQSHPFASKIQRMLEDKPLRADEIESLKNGIGLYLLLDKALENHTPPGLMAQAGNVAAQAHSADLLFAKLQPVANIDGAAVKKAASEGGLAAVGQVLGLEEAYTRDVMALVNHLPEHKFAANAIENWKAGRTQPGMGNAGIHEKIMAGIGPRVEQKLRQLQGFFHRRTEVTPEIERHEKLIANGLCLLPPTVSEGFYRKGGTISFSLQPTLNGKGLHGLNIRSHSHPDDVIGFNHVAVAAGQGADSMMRTLVHEITHTIYPNYLTQTDIARTDALTQSDRQRLNQLKVIMDQWRSAETPEVKAAIEQQIESGFAVEGKPWSKVKGAADLQTLAILVDEAWRNLNTESPKLVLSGYSEPEKRMAEVNSRYAELRFVRFREQPELLKFVVPGLTEVYDQVYLPHVERAVADMRLRQAPPPQATVATVPQSATQVQGPSASTPTQPQTIRTISAPQPQQTVAAPEAPANSILTAHAALQPAGLGRGVEGVTLQ
jgi:hypothetical protein